MLSPAKSNPVRSSRPHAWLTAAEPLRAVFDTWWLALRANALAAAPKGDGATVMVLPGFATADPMTRVLRNYLSFLGYSSEPWELGYNTGFRKLGEEQVHLRSRLFELYERSGRKVALVGWSLGGLQSRLLAHEHPEMVRQVITLGSPFRGDPFAVAIHRLYALVSGEDVASDKIWERFKGDSVPPIRVPTTAIYSATDGIAPSENCIDPVCPDTRHIEVGGSHLGLTHNANAFLAIAEELSRVRHLDGSGDAG